MNDVHSNSGEPAPLSPQPSPINPPPEVETVSGSGDSTVLPEIVAARFESPLPPRSPINSPGMKSVSTPAARSTVLLVLVVPVEIADEIRAELSLLRAELAARVQVIDGKLHAPEMLAEVNRLADLIARANELARNVAESPLLAAFEARVAEALAPFFRERAGATFFRHGTDAARALAEFIAEEPCKNRRLDQARRRIAFIEMLLAGEVRFEFQGSDLTA